MQTPDRRLVTEAALETTEAALVDAIGDAADETYRAAETRAGELDTTLRSEVNAATDTAVTAAQVNTLNLSRLAGTSALTVAAHADRHRAAYEDAETLVETWADTTAWSAGTGLASGGYLIGAATGTQAGHNRAFPVAAGERVRLSSSLFVPSVVGPTSKFAFIGLANTVSVAGSGTVGIGVDPATHRPVLWQGSGVGGAGSTFLSTDVLPTGTYRVLVVVDELAISLSLVDAAHTVEYRANVLRTTMPTIAALSVFQSDTRGAGGIRVGALAAKRSSATITPRSVGSPTPQTLSYTTNWADLTGWTAAGATVSGGRLYAGGAATGATTYPLLSPDLTDLTLDTRMVVPAAGGSNALFLVGLQASVASGNGSGDLVGIGFNNANTVQGWRGSNMGGAGGSTLNGTAQAAGTYPVRVRISGGTLTFTVSSADGASTLGTTSYPVSSLPKTPLRVGLWVSDARVAAGIALESLTLSQVVPGGVHYFEGGVDSVTWTRPLAGSTANARIALPKNYDSRRPAPVIIHAHGTGRLGGAPFDDSQVRPYWQGLLDAGYIVASTDGAGNAWGSPAAVTDYEALMDYVASHYAVTGFVLQSQSMGGPALLNLLRGRNAGAIAAWYGVAPVVNLRAQYDLSTSFASQIRAAYGIAADGSDYEEKIGASDPASAQGSDFRGIPMRVITYADDNVVPPASNAVPLLGKVAPYTPEASYTTVAGTSHIGGGAFDVIDTVAFFQRHLPAPVSTPGSPAATVLTSPNGTRFRLTVGDDGALTTTTL